jgi:hypothetical protein
MPNQIHIDGDNVKVTVTPTKITKVDATIQFSIEDKTEDAARKAVITYLKNRLSADFRIVKDSISSKKILIIVD